MLNDADENLKTELAQFLPPRAFPEDFEPFRHEPRGTHLGQVGLVVAPASTDEVARIIVAAGAARVPVVPYGGGTGLVAGQVMPDGPKPLILSMARMTAVRAVYPVENVLVAEAGAILAHVQAAAEQAGRLFPLSLASEGSARIGGLLGTNAGGVNVLRYGNARELCLGMEAVLPNGSIWHGLKRLRKDNTGYDLRNLLIGSEGTLGVITAASLRLFPRPGAKGTAMMVVRDPQAALALLAMAQASGGVSAFELISGMGMQFLTEVGPDVRQPFDTVPEWTVLIDLGLPEGQSPEAVLEDLFAAGLEQDLVSDGVIAASEAQRNQLWAVRESIPEANKRIGAISSHDISLPIGLVPEFIARAGVELAAMGDYRINCFGHLGDGNLHYNVYPLRGQDRAVRMAEKPRVQALVHDLTHAMEGSISAEHGIGRLKAADLQHYGDPAKLAAMRAIKAALDPLGIMNTGAVLR